jgi:hypothetical protein
MPDDLYKTSGFTPEGAACPVDPATGAPAPGYAAQGRASRESFSGRAAPARDSAGGAAAQGRSIPDLIRGLTRDMGTLVRQEAALAKAEVREKVAVYARNAAMIGIGAVLALGGFIVLLGALSTGLAAWMDAAGMSPGVYSWLAPLIVGAVTLGIAALLVTKAINKLKCESFAPEKTAQSLRETGEWVKEKVS